MKQINYLEILKLFKINDNIKKNYLYLNDYSEKIELWLNNNELNKEQIIRYMLVGFFFDYRASNHKGQQFNTIIENKTNKMKTLVKKHPDFFKLHKFDLNEYNNKIENSNFKKSVFNNVNGKPIESTEQYLKLLKIEEMTNLTGKKFFDYVISGSEIT